MPFGQAVFLASHSLVPANTACYTQANQKKAWSSLQEPSNCNVYFSSLFFPFDIRLFVEIVFGLMLIG
jgi:hypothetical protein